MKLNKSFIKGFLRPLCVFFNRIVQRLGSVITTQVKKRPGYYKALPQVLAVSVKNVLLMVFGMTIGYTTILIPGLSGSDPDPKFHLGSDAISWIGSIGYICVPIGCLISGPITQPLGRKRSMQLANLPFIVAWLTLKYASEVWHIFFSICLIGVTGGLLEAPVITYVAEVTQPHLRGMLSSTSAIAVILGLLIQFLLGTFLTWRTAAVINIFPVTFSFFILFLIPESPHWLISKNRLQEARESLAWLRGWTTLEAIEPEFQDLYKTIQKSEGIVGQEDRVCQREHVGKHLMRKSFFWPYALICFIFFLNHFSGTTTLQTYAVKIFSTLKTPVDEYYATVFMGSVQLLGSIICVTSMQYFGKRILTFISIVGTAICFGIAGTYSYFINVKYLHVTYDNATMNSLQEELQDNNFTWVPMVSLLGAAFLSAIGSRTLPWILIGEVYSTEARSVASGLSGAAGYVFGFTTNKVFLSMINLMTLPGVFWFYCALGIVGNLILVFTLPETEGKPLCEITDHFDGKCMMDNNVRRKIKKKVPENGHSNTVFTIQDEGEKRIYVA